MPPEASSPAQGPGLRSCGSYGGSRGGGSRRGSTCSTTGGIGSPRVTPGPDVSALSSRSEVLKALSNAQQDSPQSQGGLMRSMTGSRGGGSRRGSFVPASNCVSPAPGALGIAEGGRTGVIASSPLQATFFHKDGGEVMNVSQTPGRKSISRTLSNQPLGRKSAGQSHWGSTFGAPSPMAPEGEVQKHELGRSAAASCRSSGANFAGSRLGAVSVTNEGSDYLSPPAVGSLGKGSPFGHTPPARVEMSRKSTRKSSLYAASLGKSLVKSELDSRDSPGHESVNMLAPSPTLGISNASSPTRTGPAKNEAMDVTMMFPDKPRMTAMDGGGPAKVPVRPAARFFSRMFTCFG